MSAPQVCPALRRAREMGGTVTCEPEPAPAPRGVWGFTCWDCLAIMLGRAADREAMRQEWEVQE